MATATETEEGVLDRPQVLVALLVGLVLTLMGLGGFLSGPEGTLLGFGRNYLHDAVHVLTGGLGLGAGYYASGRMSDEYNKYAGLMYVLVFAGGLVFFDLFQDLINLNTADHFLHLFLAVVLAGVGFGLADRE